jgi:arylformamidase
MPLLDLSHVYADGMFASPANPAPHFELCRRLGPLSPNVTHGSLTLHTGTHIDSPRHFCVDGMAVDEIPLERLCGDATCAAVRVPPQAEIDAATLRDSGARPSADGILVISTGWWRHFADHERYAAHPYLSLDAADLLLEMGIRLLAIDTPTPDAPEIVRGPGFDWPVHRRLLEQAVLIAENLTNLEPLEGKRFRFAALPLAIAGADGSPVRAVAAP